MNLLLYVTVIAPLAVAVAATAAWVYGYLFPARYEPRPGRFDTVHRDDVAVLIATRNGAGTIADTVTAALANGVPVFVVSDDSTDTTVDVAAAAGATVHALTVNVGKPAALHAGYETFDMSDRFDAVVILDDDVLIDPDFVDRCVERMDGDTAIVVGRNVTLVPRSHRWNPWLIKRAYAYWSYQLIVRRVQSALGVMNCISGSNSMYRTGFLDTVLPTPPPYIVDDTFWTLEAHRADLGRIVYAPRARAMIQDPTNLTDWYRQNLRWMWGTFQGVAGHRVGRHATRFDACYMVLIAQWVAYVLLTPAAIIFAIGTGWWPWALALYAGWVTAAAAALRLPRMILLAPFIVAADLVYRVVFVHALLRTVRQPTVDACRWTSPTRITTP